MERIVILYHGNCPDGFGGAYAAWKKFGESATYIPLSRGEEPPYELVRGAHAYFVDFCYTQEVMDQFVSTAEKVTVLDHHEGVESVIKSMPEYVYECEHSGAAITWKYFHPELPLPRLLAFVEDIDLYRFALPETRAIITYLEVQPMTFEHWDSIARKLDDPASTEHMLERARIYAEYFELLAADSAEHAKKIMFEGYEVFFASTHPIKSMKSLVGNLLAKRNPPFSLVVTAHPEGYGVSIRGDGTIDVAAIAQKYGGNGHPSSAGFLIPRDGPFPWTLVKTNDDADTRN